MAEHNPFQDINPQFFYYSPAPLPKVNSVIKNELFGDIDLPGYEVRENGAILAPANTPESQEYNYNNLMSEMAATHREQIPEQSIPTTEPTTTKKSTVKQNLKGNEKKAMSFFQSKGLTSHQAAGLVGNLIRESRLDPTAVNKHSGAIGIAQWLGDRKKKLLAKYGKNPTFDQQLDFVWEELNSTHKKGLEMLKQSLNVEEAAANAFGWYEFSVGPKGAIQEMKKHGQDGLKSYNQGIEFSKTLLLS